MKMEFSQQADRKPRILIVEDDASMRRSMQLSLLGQGFDVYTYATGDTLMLAGVPERAACLVADFRLGETNGIHLLRMLRAQGWSGPAILVTAYPSCEVRHSAHAAGFDLFLEKPFGEHVLANAIARLIKHYPDART